MFSRVTVTALRLGTKQTTLRVKGRSSGIPLVLVHGNLATSLLYADLMEKLPNDIFAVAMDMRGYGDYQGPAIKATLGLRSFADDLKDLLAELKIPKAHFLGWSLGGGIVQTLHMTYPDLVLSEILEAPCPPYGYGGIQGADGKANYPDFAGSGGGLSSPQLIHSFKTGDLSESNPLSVRSVFNTIVWNPPYRPSLEHEEMYLRDVLKTKLGPDFYPGDRKESPNWPGFAPGEKGLCNAISPKYHNCSDLVKIGKKTPILWIRGNEDKIVSEEPGGCYGTLGKQGVIGSYPGEKVFPPQPMLSQTRHLLTRYSQQGGSYREVAFPKCGHSPHLEQESLFLSELTRHLSSFGPN